MSHLALILFFYLKMYFLACKEVKFSTHLIVHKSDLMIFPSYVTWHDISKNNNNNSENEYQFKKIKN